MDAPSQCTKRLIDGVGEKNLNSLYLPLREHAGSVLQILITVSKNDNVFKHAFYTEIPLNLDIVGSRFPSGLSGCFGTKCPGSHNYCQLAQ
jgi:hypothetical protein